MILLVNLCSLIVNHPFVEIILPQMQNLQFPFAKYLSARMSLVFFSENCDTKSSSPLSIEYYMYIPMLEEEDGVRFSLL